MRGPKEQIRKEKSKKLRYSGKEGEDGLLLEEDEGNQKDIDHDDSEDFTIGELLEIFDRESGESLVEEKEADEVNLEGEVPDDSIWIIFDVESTGFLTKEDEITQLAATACEWKNQKLHEIGNFDTFVQSYRPIPFHVERLTQILSIRKKGSVLKDAPAPKKAFLEFFSWVKLMASQKGKEKVTFVGHNIRKFDIRLLLDQGIRSGHFLSF